METINPLVYKLMDSRTVGLYTLLPSVYLSTIRWRQCNSRFVYGDTSDTIINSVGLDVQAN